MTYTQQEIEEKINLLSKKKEILKRERLEKFRMIAEVDEIIKYWQEISPNQTRVDI